MFGLTRQERGIVAFLTAGLVLGALVTVYKREIAPPQLPEVDARTVAAFDSISQELSRHDEEQPSRFSQPAIAPEPGTADENGTQTDVLELGSIDINRAGIDELDRLPGVGPVVAGRIVAYRETHGFFESPEDLLQVKGIGSKTLEKIRPFVTFSVDHPIPATSVKR